MHQSNPDEIFDKTLEVYCKSAEEKAKRDREYQDNQVAESDECKDQEIKE